MKIGTYVKESYAELVHKVSWPSVAELQSSAIVVMVASIIISLVIMAMDTVFKWLMEHIYTLLY
jgi:preprotein translocase subunit SecE